MRISFNTAFGRGEILVVSSWAAPDQVLVRGNSKETKAVIREWLDQSYGVTGHPLTELATPQDLHVAVANTRLAVMPFLLGLPQITDGNEMTDYQTEESQGVVE